MLSFALFRANLHQNDVLSITSLLFPTTLEHCLVILTKSSQIITFTSSFCPAPSRAHNTASGLFLAFSCSLLNSVVAAAHASISCRNLGPSIGIHSICRFRRTRLFRGCLFQRARSHRIQKQFKISSMFHRPSACTKSQRSICVM